MSSSLITRIEREKEGPYTVIFTTDDLDKYRHIDDECRKIIGHAKPIKAADVLTMRLIYADNLLECYEGLDKYHVPVGVVKANINDMPTVDAVPVVRCRECLHRDPEDHKCECGEDERQGCPFPVDDDYFCKYGARREWGDDDE